ncbi:uncharacterized protein LOC119902691 [Micropterus salmoides]|uniref:uncharacterized protein LOC119902691 n=1 Tax=Micropterus salmoides TaxID=27706 RepID=UPI0018ECF20B|nr:uncharacterized protein LOC119902691 [Micropterus salmoides]XP_038574956.1 uncharacterized protein LOC119902691 [Micropterus salmoides]
MDSEASGTMEVAALGRPFSLGMLYDCRKDSLVPGITLWDRNDLEKDKGERPKPNTDFEIVASESIEDKSSALNIEASLKTSFLSGLVEVDGSAKYLNDSKISKNQARVTLKYKATTKFQELSMDHLGRDNMKHSYVFDKGLATHVVTAILYGAQAFFVFDHEVSKKEDHQDIEGNLKVMIKKIPSLAIEGEGSLKLKDKDRANVEKFSCRFFGDFALEKSPVSFQDAVEVYQSLPRLLGANGEKAVPMKVWLLPLTSLDSSAAKLVRQISLGLVQESQRVLEDFSELEMRCNDTMRTTTAQQFPQIGKKIKSFKEMCSEFKLGFQQNLAKKLPAIRGGGGEEEAVLAEILKKRHSSPFNTKDLNEWMDCKEREVYTLMSLTNMMKNTTIITSQTHLYRETLSAEHAVCFVFTSLGSAEPYLSALSNYIKQTPEADDPQDVEKEQWFTSKEITDAMRNKAKLFSDFAEANKENKNIKFLTVGLTNETQKGSSIYLHEGGFSVNKNFEPPSKPETVTASDIKHNSVTLKISAPRFGAENITSYSIEYCVRGEDGWQQETASKAGEVTVSHLSPNTEYMFRCRAVTSAGFGPANEASGSIKTLPTTKTCSSLSDSVKEKSTLLEPQTGPVPVYKIPLKDERISAPGCRSFSFGKKSTKPNRTIMLLGATGAGKSTLINGMINYILGVEWEDSYRFKLIDEGQSRSQAESQTSEVTVYKINHQEGFKTEYSLTIVDTPEFGDTRGLIRDRQITEQLCNLFSAELGVSEIDAVCFVAQASLARLTPTQKYVFDSILSIFGKDVAENIRVLVTFADGQRPPVLEAINASGVPCPKTKDGLPVHFKFNNSALFADNKSSAAGSMSGDDEDEDGGFDQMCWNMGTKSMKRFFAALNLTETKSLTMMKKVLRERKQLENSVENLQEQVKVQLATLQEIKDTTEKLKENEAEISRNEHFKFKIIFTKPVQLDILGTGDYFMNCQQCDVTCHYASATPNDADKIRCLEMGSDGYCNQCPGKCFWSVHFIQKYRWEYQEVQEKRTVKELREKYLKASEAKAPVQVLIDKLKAEYDHVQTSVVNLMKWSFECLNRLKEIELKANPLSAPEYIDMLIEGEKSEAKPGWKKRVQSLLTWREQAEIIATIYT